MSPAPASASRWRAALLLALLAGAAWVLAQGCTLLWQAAAAQALAQELAAGHPLYAWNFASPAAVIAPGSEGLEGAQRSSAGSRPADGAAVVDLSLQLDGRAVAGQAYGAARLTLRTAVPARVLLLAPAADGGIAEVAAASVQPGEHTLQLALAPFAPSAGWLRLRIERAAPGRLLLHRLALTRPRCDAPDADTAAATRPAECAPGSVQALRPRATPEAFLRARDALRALAPATLAAAAAPRPLAALVQALHARWFHGIALLGALLVLGWSWRLRGTARTAGLHGRAQRDAVASHSDPSGPRGGARQLAILLAVPVLLLLSGQPDRHDHPLVLLALLASVAAALLHPGGRRDWRWLGDRAAWVAAARLTGIGVLLIGALALLGNMLGEPSGEWRPSRLPRYLAWALLQQALLLVVIMPRLAARARDPRIAAACAGGLFALLHLPNFGLMLATLPAGTAWAAQGRRHGALLPLALSHALLGTLLVWAATPWLLRSAEVGGRYLMTG